ncbi:MAG: FkbM family methyltransferase, partial [Bacteroidales bacterium]
KLPTLHAYIDRLTYLFQKTCKSCYVRPVIKKVILKNGIRMYVDVTDRLGGLLYFYRSYSEPQTQAFISARLGLGDIFVDVGANCGFYSLLAARKVEPSGKVYAFEPNPSVCEVFRRSITLNQLESVIALENCAVAEVSDKTLNFYLPSDGVNSAIGTIVADGVMANHGNIDTSHYISITSISLDDFFSHHQPAGKVFIKIDAEGAEEQVLKGMQGLLTRKVPYCIILESDSPESLACKFINDCGYQLVQTEIFNSSSHFGNYIFTLNH